MKVLLVGNGAREHAIAKAIASSERDIELISFISRKNPGITSLSSRVITGEPENFAKLEGTGADLAFIGPEGPLARGVVDYLAEKEIPAVGPDASNSRLESSKVFCRELLSKYKIPVNPLYHVCKSNLEVEEAIRNIPEFVVKPDGLTGGKGVKVLGDHFNTASEGKNYALNLVKKDGQAIIEELLRGTEFTLQAFVSKNGSLSFMPLVKDYKRAYDGNTGPNTGSMGSYSAKDHLLPYLSPAVMEQAKTAMKRTVEAMKKETGQSYCGVLYGQFILAKNSVFLVEFNVRFGDPEAINVLSLLNDDFIDIGEAMVNGESLQAVNYQQKATVCVYIVPEGYPVKPVKDQPITVPRNSTSEIYYASVYGEPGTQEVFTTGSRAIAVLSKGETVEEAHSLAMKEVKSFSGPIFFRTDIGLA
ncbi:MAG: phosphoribosylamine--glycine ligase [Candidatus Odinarchaeota archaeon]